MLKRKILSYLLVGLFVLFIGGYCFTYVDAGEGQKSIFGADSNGSDFNGTSSAGSKRKGMAPIGGGGGSEGTTNSSTTNMDGNGGNEGGAANDQIQKSARYNCDGIPSSIPCDQIPIVTGERNHNTTENQKTQCPNGCCGIKLNTNFPIIGNCIRIKGEGAINPTNAFPTMLRALTKIIMSVILVVCFILVIVAGIMRSADKPDKAKKLLKRVAITILLLGFSGVILKLVNPNFFG